MALIRDAEIELAYGDYHEIDVKITDEIGMPVNLTGCTVRFTIKKTFMEPDSSAIITKTSAGNDVLILDPEEGTVKIILHPHETKLEPASYKFDIKVYKNGRVHTVVVGTVKVLQVVWRGD